MAVTHDHGIYSVQFSGNTAPDTVYSLIYAKQETVQRDRHWPELMSVEKRWIREENL
jgi:hypothetical protein